MNEGAASRTLLPKLTSLSRFTFVDVILWGLRIGVVAEGFAIPGLSQPGVDDPGALQVVLVVEVADRTRSTARSARNDMPANSVT